MKVRFAKDVLNDPESYRQLDEFLYIFERARHIWDSSNDEEIEGSGWLKNDSDFNRIFFEKNVRNSMLPRSGKAHSIMITVGKSQPGGELSPGDARRCLEAPAYVAVENTETDGGFLKTMLDVFERDSLKEALAEGWWQLEQMGGYGEVSKTISRVQERGSGPLRLFVLADSDRCYPNHQSKTVAKVKAACEKAQVEHHILDKRAIENYIPINVWQEMCPKKKRHLLQLFLNLSLEQRDFYHIKTGFGATFKASLSSPTDDQHLLLIRKHYEHVPVDHLKQLCSGFGEVAKWFDDERVKITPDEAETLCPKEMNELFDQIESLI